MNQAPTTLEQIGAIVMDTHERVRRLEQAALPPDMRLNIAEAAEYLGYAKATLYRLRTDHQDPRRFGKFQYLKKDLDEWLRTHGLGSLEKAMMDRT